MSTPATKDFRPWWWWVNPWLYIKRRDAAYDVALDTLRELSLDAMYPERKNNAFTPGTVPPPLNFIANRCRDCGRKFAAALVEDDKP